MPNTPALVRKGASAIAAGTHAGDPDLELAERLLGAVGIVVRVPEPMLDAVTGLSGSGPAYVFLLAEAMIEAGVLIGLPRDVAQHARATRRSSAPARCSPTATRVPRRCAPRSRRRAGTTAAGLRALEQGSVRAAILDAVTAATERSRELGPAMSARG